MVSNITPDIVDSPPSKPSPTPRLTTCRTLRRSPRRGRHVFGQHRKQEAGEHIRHERAHHERRTVHRRQQQVRGATETDADETADEHHEIHQTIGKRVESRPACVSSARAESAADAWMRRHRTGAHPRAPLRRRRSTVWRDSAHHPRLASLPPVVLAIPSRSPCTWLSADSVVPPQPYGNELAAGAVFLTLYESTRALQPNIEHVRFGG